MADDKAEQDPPAKPPKQDEDQDASRTNDGRPTPKQEILGTINKKLTTTVNGEFFEGTKSSNQNRHLQLPEIFQLKSMLEEGIVNDEKRERLLTELQRAKDEGAPKPAVSSATIHAMVQQAVTQQLEEKLRDEQIKRARLEERLHKIEDKQPATIDGAKKAKKAATVSVDDFKILQKSIAAQNAEFKKQNAEFRKQNDESKKQNAELRTKIAAQEAEINQLRSTVISLQQNVDEVEMHGGTMKKDLDRLDARVKSSNGKLDKALTVEEAVKTHTTSIAEQFAKLNQLSRTCDELWERSESVEKQDDDSSGSSDEGSDDEEDSEDDGSEDNVSDSDSSDEDDEPLPVARPVAVLRGAFRGRGLLRGRGKFRGQ